MQATKAPRASEAWARSIKAQRSACADIPIATGDWQHRPGHVEERAIRQHCDAGRESIEDQRRRRRRLVDRQARAAQRQPDEQPGADHQCSHACVTDPRHAERDSAAHNIEPAIQEMRSGNQNHAGTDRGEARHRAKGLSHGRHCADQPGKQRGSQGLHEQVRAYLAQTAAQQPAKEDQPPPRSAAVLGSVWRQTPRRGRRRRPPPSRRGELRKREAVAQRPRVPLTQHLRVDGLRISHRRGTTSQ